MKEEIVITFYDSENGGYDRVLRICNQGEKELGYDGWECGSNSMHIFVSKKALYKVLNWFEKQGLKVRRIESVKDYRSLRYMGRKGNFLNKKYKKGALLKNKEKIRSKGIETETLSQKEAEYLIKFCDSHFQRVK